MIEQEYLYYKEKYSNLEGITDKERFKHLTNIEWLRIWSDNSDPYNIDRGLISFARTLFPEDFDPQYGVGEIHKDLCRDLLQLYNPKYTNILERQLQEVLARDFSKSTWTNLGFLLYVICFNGQKIIIPDYVFPVREKGKIVKEGYMNSYNGIEATIDENLIVLSSETFTMAETWVKRDRNHLTNNRKLRQVFGNLQPEGIRSSKDNNEDAAENGQWAAGQFKTAKAAERLKDYQRGKGVTVIAKGGGQQTRGMNIDGRPTLWIMDDVYSMKNTQTLESRTKIRFQINTELKNSIDKNKGKVVAINTVVHEDTVTVDNLKSKFWKCIEHPAMDEQKFRWILDNKCKINRHTGVVEYPSKKECEELEDLGFCTNWRSRKSLYFFLGQFAEQVENRTERGFWQEMFNIAIDEQSKKIKRSQMKIAKFDIIYQNNVPFIRFWEQDGTQSFRNVNIYLGTDTAASYSKGADDSSTTKFAIDFYARIYVLKVKAGKFAVTDEFKSPEMQSKFVSKTCPETVADNLLERRGLVDEMLRITEEDNGKAIWVIETNNTGNTVVAKSYERMKMTGRRHQIIAIHNATEKVDRIISTLTPYYSSGAVYHLSEGQETLMTQIENIQVTKMDDEADSFATGVSQAIKPRVLIEYKKDKPEDKVKKYKRPDFLGKPQDSDYHKDWVVHFAN